MMNMHVITPRALRNAIIVIGIGLLMQAASFAQPAIPSPEQYKTLAERWKWALSEADKSGKPSWIGYSISKKMSRNSFIGSFNTDKRKKSPSLCEQLGFQPCVREDFQNDYGNTINTTDGATYMSGEGP